jgi:hypothetical protein
VFIFEHACFRNPTPVMTYRPSARDVVRVHRAADLAAIGAGFFMVGSLQ